MSLQTLRTEIVSDFITLRTIRSDEANVSSVTYQWDCCNCMFSDAHDNRSDALQAARVHECIDFDKQDGCPND